MVEVDAVIGVNDDAAVEGDAQQLPEFWVEKHFAVVREFNVGEAGVGVEQGFERGGVEVAGSHGCLGSSAGGGATGTCQLAVGGGVDLKGAGSGEHSKNVL